MNNNNVLSICKSTATLMSANGAAFHEILEEVEWSYEAFGGDPIGKKLLGQNITQWIRVSDLRVEGVCERETI